MDVNGGSILIVSSWADMVVVLDPCFVGYSLRFSQKMVGFILLVIILQKEMSWYPHTIYKMFSATWFNVDQPHTIHGIQFISTWNPRHCGFYLDLCCWSAIVFLTGSPGRYSPRRAVAEPLLLLHDLPAVPRARSGGRGSNGCGLAGMGWEDVNIQKAIENNHV